MMKRLRQLKLWSPGILIFLWSFSVGAQKVTTVNPRTGSLNGATRLTINGEGFAQENQFTLNSNSKKFGNSVQLVSDTRSIPCDVERDSSHARQITCYTRAMPFDYYLVRVSVDGVPIPESNICNGDYQSYWCSFYPWYYTTPTITGVVPASGLPGTIIKMDGWIVTDVYGSNTDKSSNGLDIRVLRAYVGGMPCELLKPNSDLLYGLSLISEFSQWGTMTCKMTGTYVGHHNLSYILDGNYGRSLPDLSVYTVSSLNKLAMFQSYAEVNGVSPSEGSLQGGTILTINGRFFDQTDLPVTVLVGGGVCEILSVSDNRIECKSPKHQESNITVFSGGRGLRLEMWNNSSPAQLDEVLYYNAHRAGYSLSWVDSLSYTWPSEADHFVARLSGFIVPTETDNYTFYIRGDDRYALYFSKTGLPQDKMKIAFLNSIAGSFFSSNSQKSERMHLEKGKPYYIEVLVQEYEQVASVEVGLFKEISHFTEQQTREARNEIQVITAAYDIFEERQEVSFENWAAEDAVREVQRLTINSSCFQLDSCGYTFYNLIYGSLRTVPIAVSATEEELQSALNALWSIKPDTVQVTKAMIGQVVGYDVLFISRRGDFESFSYECADADVNITVTEIIKGRPSLETFTLQWGGLLSRPIFFNASESEVQSALEALVRAECPSEIQAKESSEVFYYRDYEDALPTVSGRGTRVWDSEAFCGQSSLMNPEALFLSTDQKATGVSYGPVPLQMYNMLCFAYRGWLRDEIRVRFSYKNSNGHTATEWSAVTVLFQKGNEWRYICVNLLSPLKTAYTGSSYSLLDLYLYGEMPNQDFFIDVVHLGSRPTSSNVDGVIQMRRPPALGRLGIFLKQVSVHRLPQADTPCVFYVVTATPYNCGHSLPLLGLGFFQASNSSEDMVVFGMGGGRATVTRTQRASPPMSGSFDIEIYGKRVEGLPVNLTAEELQYSLQGVPEMGQLQVTRTGRCTGYQWTVKWLSNPGNQPLLQINSSSVVGINPRIQVTTQTQGGLFKSMILGDFLRVPESGTQVQVLINGIPSKCTGNCGFGWRADRTPTITGISPKQGSYAQGTNLTITGYGFANEGGMVLVGDVECPVLQFNSTSLTCQVGEAKAGSFPVSVSFASLGHAGYEGGAPLNFINQMGAFFISPSSGSEAGGTLLNVSGYGFGDHTSVLIGAERCAVVSSRLDQLSCRTPPGVPSTVAVSLEIPDMSVPVDANFTYDNMQTPLITSMSPMTADVMGQTNLTILGARFQDGAGLSLVLVGGSHCRIFQWSSGSITCLLPKLPPGIYNVHVQVENIGFARTSPDTNSTIEYILEVTSVFPEEGSLYGGTKLTIMGSGFSPDLTNNHVSVGDGWCEVTAASEHQLECVTQASKRTYTVTNQGTHPDYGEGYAWSPSSLTVRVGDVVAWRWASPSFVPGLGYRVFSISSPSSTTYDGVGFTSGDAKTESGFYSYCFTTPGIYYYSSGYVDDRYQKFMQGVVVVGQVKDRNGRLNITVGGIEATYKPVPQSSDLVTPECTSETSPNCSGNLSLDQPADGFTFHFLGCLSPVVLHITPNQGTTHTVILIEGVGFSNTSCANEVTVGGHACILINSTATEIYCHLSQDSGLDIAIAHPVSVRVNNLGTAITSVPSDFGRHFVVLPVIDSVIPSIGSTTGHTRLTVQGSGFSSQILAVSVVDQPCTILSVNYTVVVCDTLPSPVHIGSVNLRVGRTRAYCQGNCTFEYSSLLVPQIIEVSPASIGRNSTTVVVTGLGFGGRLADVAVFAGDISLKVVEVTDTNITLVVGPLPAGDYTLMVVIASIGLASGDANLRSPPDAWLSPASGSTQGGTPLFITGNGFWPGNTSVTVGGLACQLVWVTLSAVRCLTPAHTEGNTIVQLQVFSVAYPPLNFTYSRVDTPVVSAVSPATGPTGTSINITGSGFGTDPNIILVTIDEVACNLTALTDTEFQCDVGEHAGGTFSVTVHHMVKGYATSQALFSYELRMTTIIPSEGGYGGGSIVSIHGSGFDQKFSRVQICGKDCEVQRQMSTPTYLYCKVPSINSTTAQQVCAVQVLNGNTSVNRSSSFVYKSSLTPVIAGVSPRRGGTAGGTRLTIWGSNFSLNSSEISVDIAGSACDVDFANNTHIICTTNAQPTSQQAKVQVNIGDRGIAKVDSANFLYIDVWSSMYTWGGLSPPETGTFVVITKGQTILLDTSTPVLKMLLIQGGTLVFDELDIELQAENILITEGGTLQVGTETAPFQHKAIITLHGHLRSQELPVYGAKTLAVREGVLDLHGIPIPVPWTWLAETALAGSSTLTLQQTVTWREGDEIVISSTGNRQSQKENEVRRIAFVSADGQTLNLTKPLMYTHLGVSVTMPNGVVFEGRAEVGLLTRNIVVRGSENLEWSDKIEACPAGFNTGEFATQTCFQGRFGEEIGSDQFGGCIMFHAPRPSQNLAIGRIEYVEVFHAGQAFRLGRYPIHWHLMGDLQYKSYIRGCAIHQSYNRAVTIHNTHNLLVERNVIYDIMGGAFFIEDGIETGNILQYNLALFVKQSTTLLNDDVTPAAFWVTNPNNTIRHNVAAGGTHFGFWYRMHEHPDGPSYNPQICQKFVPLGEFFNNTVHSQGWFGLWIFQDYFPMKEGQCGSMVPLPAVFRSLTTWNCEKGAEWVNVGAVQFSGFLMVNNEKAGVEAKRILSQFVSGWGENGGAVLINSTIVGYIDELGLGTGYCSNRGVVLPLDDGMSVLSTTFVNFDRLSCTAIGVASIDGTCVDHCGGWSAQFHGIRFYNCPNKAGFRWPHEVVLVDKDGSLTGHIDHRVVPLSNLLDPAHCLQSTEWSVGFPGAVCDNTVGFHRLAFNNPSPSSLYAKDVVLTNSHGTSIVPYLKKLITHNFGWMALVPTSETYNWYFDKMDFVTNMSYTATFYGYKQEDYIIINHNLTQSPDSFKIVDWRNSSDQPLDFSRNVNGDWYFNKTTKTVYYMVSGKSQRKRRDTVNRAQTDIRISFQVYRCFFKDCIVPAPDPALEPALATLLPLPNRRPVLYSRWSNESFWRSSPENNFTVPREGANVIIPLGTWIVMDIDIPPLNKITLFGVLEIPDTMNETRNISQYRSVVLNATHISIQGGRLIAGWRDSPFQGRLQIVLRGMHSTPEWLLPSGPNQGAKVLGVFGSLDLYGMPHNVYHTKLARSAPAGSSILSLKKAVDWQVGDEIVISTTSYDPWQTEVRKIAAVFNSGRTLTLNQSLSYAHSGVRFNVPGTTGHYTLAADVGLLSKNIKIIGEDHPDWYTESFGGRVLVGSFTNGGIMYRGTAQIRNVEFYHTGQFGYPDSSDPRYSVVFLNLGQVSENDSYIQGCSFHQGFSPAIGVFGTDGLSIDDNVIYFTVGEGIRVWGNDIRVQRNLVTMSVWPGAYQDREQDNSEWTAAIEVSEGGNVLLQDNIVAGYERVAYRIDGELCPDAMNSMESWYQNEAHGGLYGVYMNQDGLAECSLIQGFTIWRSFDYGIYVQVPMSVRIANVTLVDNGMGVMSIIYSPPSVSHQYSNKTVHIQDSLIVGTSSDLNCSQVLSPSDANIRLSQIHRSPRPPNGGRSGVCWPNFASGHNNAPQQAHAGLSSYNAISGLMTVTDTVFVGFGTVCPKQGSVMFMTNPSNGDLQHPIHIKGVMMVDSTENAKVFIQRSDVRLVNPSDCVDMDCDAKKKALLKDLDGSFLGGAGAVVPQSEFEWGGDRRRGLGDYRIPKVILTSLNGSRIPVNQIAPNKGVIRDASCTYMPDWQSYKCFGLNYEMLVIESLDADTETRRVSPVAVLGSSYVDLLNGPQDHGWCAGYTCQRRVSLFHSIVATNKSFDVYFTSVTPQKLRLMLLNSDDSKVVRVAVFYSKPQRLDVYVNSSLVAPTNAIWNSDKTDYTLQEPSFQEQYVPQLNSTVHGSNYFDRNYKMLNVLVRGSTPVEIHTSPLLFISFQLPAMTEEQFFGKNLVRNLALFLKVPVNMIRVTKVVRQGGRSRRRRDTGLTVEVEISKPPAQQVANSSSEAEVFSTLKNIANELGQAAVSGNLSESIGFNVSSIGIISPPPPSSDAAWLQEASQEVTREEPGVSYVSSVSALLVVVQPVAGEFGGLLTQQPSIMAINEQDDCVSVGVTSLTLTVRLKVSNDSIVPGLGGNTTIPFVGCWANYTDLVINAVGDNMMLAFTLNAVQALSKSFIVRAGSNTIMNSTSTPGIVIPTAGSSTTSSRQSIPDSGVLITWCPLCLFALVYSLMLCKI